MTNLTEINNWKISKYEIEDFICSEVSTGYKKERDENDNLLLLYNVNNFFKHKRDDWQAVKISSELLGFVETFFQTDLFKYYLDILKDRVIARYFERRLKNMRCCSCNKKAGQGELKGYGMKWNSRNPQNPICHLCYSKVIIYKYNFEEY